VFQTTSVTPMSFHSLDASFRNRQHSTAPFSAVLSGRLQHETFNATFMIPMFQVNDDSQFL